MRYCIVSDDSGHKYLCPLDKREEAEATLNAISTYWDNFHPDNPENPPVEPDYLERINPHMLSFTDPQLN